MKLSNVVELLEAWNDLIDTKILTGIKNKIQQYLASKSRFHNEPIFRLCCNKATEIFERLPEYKESKDTVYFEGWSHVTSSITYDTKTKQTKLSMSYVIWGKGNADKLLTAKVIKEMRKDLNIYDKEIEYIKEDINSNVLDDYEIQLMNGKAAIYHRYGTGILLVISYTLDTDILSQSKSFVKYRVSRKLTSIKNQMREIMKLYIPTVECIVGMRNLKEHLVINISLASHHPIKWADVSEEAKSLVSINTKLNYFDVNNSYDLVRRLVDAVIHQTNIMDMVYMDEIKHRYNTNNFTHSISIPIKIEQFEIN